MPLTIMVLKDKVALITGGSRGIGSAISLEMAKNGAKVVFLYSANDEAAQQTLDAVKEYDNGAKCYKCDISSFEEVKKTVDIVLKEFGGIDILVNNAGITADKLILTMNEKDFDSVIDTNLKGAFNLIKHTYLNFVKRRQGRIINISSVSGITGNAGQANYSSAKAGIIGLTKTVAKELASRGVTCNAIAPGFIETDMTAKLPENIKDAALSNIPLKKMGSTKDVAALAVFLASESAGYITGEVIKVDGGLYI